MSIFKKSSAALFVLALGVSPPVFAGDADEALAEASCAVVQNAYQANVPPDVVGSALSSVGLPAAVDCRVGETSRVEGAPSGTVYVATVAASVTDEVSWRRPSLECGGDAQYIDLKKTFVGIRSMDDVEIGDYTLFIGPERKEWSDSQTERGCVIESGGKRVPHGGYEITSKSSREVQLASYSKGRLDGSFELLQRGKTVVRDTYSDGLSIGPKHSFDGQTGVLLTIKSGPPIDGTALRFVDGAPRGITQMVDGVAQGVYVRWGAEPGQVLERGNMSGGEKSGSWETWHPNGELASRGDYFGRPVGAWETWRSDGSRESKKNYGTDGQLDGEQLAYFPSEKLQLRETFKAGQRSGPYVAYHDNGQKRLQGTYARDKKTGTWSVYNTSGKTEESWTYAKGQRTAWRTGNADGKKGVEDEFSGYLAAGKMGSALDLAAMLPRSWKSSLLDRMTDHLVAQAGASAARGAQLAKEYEGQLGRGRANTIRSNSRKAEFRAVKDRVAATGQVPGSFLNRLMVGRGQALFFGAGSYGYWDCFEGLTQGRNLHSQIVFMKLDNSSQEAPETGIEAFFGELMFGLKMSLRSFLSETEPLNMRAKELVSLDEVKFQSYMMAGLGAVDGPAISVRLAGDDIRVRLDDEEDGFTCKQNPRQEAHPLDEFWIDPSKRADAIRAWCSSGCDKQYEDCTSGLPSYRGDWNRFDELTAATCSQTQQLCKVRCQ